MTFPARLTELLEKINKGEHADSFELTVHLVNHAEAIRDLVVSTDLMLAAWDSENYKAFVIHKKMVKESLAKLKEQS